MEGVNLGVRIDLQIFIINKFYYEQHTSPLLLPLTFVKPNTSHLCLTLDFYRYMIPVQSLPYHDNNNDTSLPPLNELLESYGKPHHYPTSSYSGSMHSRSHSSSGTPSSPILSPPPASSSARRRSDVNIHHERDHPYHQHDPASYHEAELHPHYQMQYQYQYQQYMQQHQMVQIREQQQYFEMLDQRELMKEQTDLRRREIATMYGQEYPYPYESHPTRRSDPFPKR